MQKLVNFMARIRENKVNFKPDNLVLTAGSTSANEILMFCLTEPGEAFLLPTPYYAGYNIFINFDLFFFTFWVKLFYSYLEQFTQRILSIFVDRFDRDLKWRTGAEIVPIHCSSSDGFKITMSALEEAYQRAKKLNLKVKGVLVTNPSNPLGTTLTRDELNHLITFSIANNVHIVSDEIYSGTVFDSPSFVSITEAVMDRNLEHTDLWSRIHIVYSLSKDLGLPGFRVGMIYSNNETVVSAATKMSSFGLVSSQTQFLLADMLSDKKFTNKYMKENKERLKKRKEMLVSGLKLAGINYLESNAGLFCWVDMSHLLVSNTFDAEKELWEQIIEEAKLNISPGSSFHCTEPGWFRICFANMCEETIQVALKRLKDFAQSINSKKKAGSCSRQRRFLLGKWVSMLLPYDSEPDR